MGQTRWFGLSFFDFGEKLSSPLNIQKEIDRFVVIDKQLYGLYNIFGNGVIDGWTVNFSGYTDENGITISVSEGLGIIKYMAAQTDLPGYVYNLPPNSVSDIYAIIRGETLLDRTVSFISSSFPISSDDKIRIARVATGDNSVFYVDNNVRDLIGFEEIIREKIGEHRHRGIPSKIDLRDETKNQLPGARISDIDASQVTSGVFGKDRIPIIDHNQLYHNGLLTHEALDSFVKTLSQSNKELLGEINSSNLIKTILFLKYIYPDVDKHFINELAILPGISPDNYIDFESSTANINLSEGCISGKPVEIGMYTSVYWNNDQSFLNNRFISKNHDSVFGDMIIENNTVSLRRSSDSIKSIVNFDVLINMSNVFDLELLVIDNNQKATIVQKMDGNISAQLGGGARLVYYYRKNFSQDKWFDLDGKYDKIIVKIKTSEQIHKPLYMYFVNGSNLSNIQGETYGSLEKGDISGVKVPQTDIMILAQDENMLDFKEFEVDISNLGITSLSQINFYTEDDFTFYVDDIYAIREDMVVRNGSINFRYITQSNVVFHSVFFDADVPENTLMRVRIKTASSEDGLNRSEWSYPINSGSVISLSGSASEIEVYMESDSSQNYTPILDNLELRMMVDSNISGFVLDKEQDWVRGELRNINMLDSVEDGKSILGILPPINVNGKYFSINNSVSELNLNNNGVLGFSGGLMPISPSQAKLWDNHSLRGFNFVSSVMRRYDKNFLITDLYNNRVLEISSNGKLVKGFGSSYTTDSSLYPVSCVYNPLNNMLTIVFTKKVEIKDITSIKLYVGSSLIRLIDRDTVVRSNKSSGKIIEIQLSKDTYSRLVGVSDNLSVNFDSNAFSESISFPFSESSGSNNIYSVIGGMVCFVGDFTYIDNILHPVHVYESMSGNWIILNSSIHYEEKSHEDEEATVPDLIEINPRNINDLSNKMSLGNIKFSDFTLGSIFEYERDRFIVSGLRSGTNGLGDISGDDLINEYEGQDVPENVKFRAKAIDALGGYVGRVFVVDKINDQVYAFYNSPDGLFPSSVSQFSDGDILCSESSFYESSGRLIRLDTFGNIKWNYGGGIFNVINSSKVAIDDNIIISV